METWKQSFLRVLFLAWIFAIISLGGEEPRHIAAERSDSADVKVENLKVDIPAIAACEIDMPADKKETFDAVHHAMVAKSEWVALDGMMPEFNTIRMGKPKDWYVSISDHTTCLMVRNVAKWNPDCVFLINVTWVDSHHSKSGYCMPTK